jgi:hypothetical protein
MQKFFALVATFENVHEDELFPKKADGHYPKGDCIREFLDGIRGYGPFVCMDYTPYDDMFETRSNTLLYKESSFRLSNQHLMKRIGHVVPVFFGSKHSRKLKYVPGRILAYYKDCFVIQLLF